MSQVSYPHLSHKSYHDLDLNKTLNHKAMSNELYHIEERTTTGWHLVDSARVPMPKDVCWQAYQDLVEDGGDPADLRIVRDR